MEIGKLPNDVLKDVVIDKLNFRRDDVILRPGLGEDCSVVKNGDNCYIISSDPITGATKNIGKLAVNVACNDIASSGVEPIGIMLTVLLPPYIEIEEISNIIKDVNEACNELKVEVLGGHTEVTDAVNRVVISSTVVGNSKGMDFVRTSGAKLGDKLIMTKSAGIEATAIVAKEKENELTKAFGNDFTNEAMEYINNISVLKEGIICGKLKVNSMHDITEGGVYGAVWEVAEASGCGAVIYHDKIPVSDITKRICDFYKVDYAKIISSGSMLIAAENAEQVIDELKNNGIQSTVIGEIKEQGKYIIQNGKKLEMPQPEVDELYKIV